MSGTTSNNANNLPGYETHSVLNDTLNRRITKIRSRSPVSGAGPGADSFTDYVPPRSPVGTYSSEKTQNSRYTPYEESLSRTSTISNINVRSAVKRQLSPQMDDQQDEDALFDPDAFLSDDDNTFDVYVDPDTVSADPEDILVNPVGIGSMLLPDDVLDLDVIDPVANETEWRERYESIFDRICMTCSRPVYDIQQQIVTLLNDFSTKFDFIVDDLPDSVATPWMERIQHDGRVVMDLLKDYPHELDTNAILLLSTEGEASFDQLYDWVHENISFIEPIKKALEQYMSTDDNNQRCLIHEDSITVVPILPTNLEDIPGRLTYETEKLDDGQWSIKATKYVPCNADLEIIHGITLQDVFATAGADMLFMRKGDPSLRVFDNIYLTDNKVVVRINNLMRDWVVLNYLNAHLMNAETFVMQSVLYEHGISYGHLCCRNTFASSLKLANAIKVINFNRFNLTVIMGDLGGAPVDISDSQDDDSNLVYTSASKTPITRLNGFVDEPYEMFNIDDAPDTYAQEHNYRPRMVGDGDDSADESVLTDEDSDSGDDNLIDDDGY